MANKAKGTAHFSTKIKPNVHIITNSNMARSRHMSLTSGSTGRNKNYNRSKLIFLILFPDKFGISFEFYALLLL
jgi:hypothetical protein